jgi:hypothetical protein
MNYLTVEVRKGDCVWFGRYRASCELYTGKMLGLQVDMDKGSFDHSLDQRETKSGDHSVWIVNSLGQRVGNYPKDKAYLKPGIYFLVIEGNKEMSARVFIQD